MPHPHRHLSNHLPLHLSTPFIPVHLLMYLPTHPLPHLPMYLPTYSSTYPPMYLPTIYLPIVPTIPSLLPMHPSMPPCPIFMNSCIHSVSPVSFIQTCQPAFPCSGFHKRGDAHILVVYNLTEPWPAGRRTTEQDRITVDEHGHREANLETVIPEKWHSGCDPGG